MYDPILIDCPAEKVVAETRVLLLASRREETNIGNLITDSMVDYVSIYSTVVS